MLSNKLVSSDKITLVKNDNIITDDTNIVKTFNVLRIKNENARDSTLKAILQYCNHPNILVIKERTKSGSVSTF